MPLAKIETLAVGDWDQDTAQKLDIAEYSGRYLLYGLLLKETRDQPELMGPLPPMSEAIGLWRKAEIQDQAIARDFMLHPPVGQWLGGTLRRIRHGPQQGDEGRPLWADLGYAHTLAAAAAHRTGLEATIRVPMYNGQAVFPTLGRATVPYNPSAGAWQTAEVRTSKGGLELSTEVGKIMLPSELTEDAPGWEAARWLRLVASNGLPWDVLLDDLDRFTGLGVPSMPERLTLESFAAWRKGLGDGWEELALHHPLFAQQVAGKFGLRSIVPAPPKMRFQPHSVSHGDSPNSAIMSRPQHPIEAAVTIVHEHCGHNILNIAQHMFSELTPQLAGEEEYAPWRDDPRHNIGLFHGVKAFSTVLEFYHQRLGIDSGEALEIAQFQFALLRNEVGKASLQLLSHNQLGDLTVRFVNAIRNKLIGPLLDVPVPPEAQLRAHLVALDHASKWSAQHLPFSDEALHGAAEAWCQGKPVPPEIFETLRSLAANEEAKSLNVIEVLVCSAIASPDILNQPGMLPAEATPTDVALAAALMNRTDLPAGKWAAIQQAMGHILQAQRRTPHDLLSAVHARINRVAAEAPSWQELTDWLAEGAVSHLRRQGDDMLPLRYRRHEGNEGFIEEMLADIVRRNKAGELGAEDAARQLMCLGFVCVGTAVRKRIYHPRVPYTNIPDHVVDPNRLEFGDWRPRLTDSYGRPLAGVRAGRMARPAVWAAVIGDPNEPFQRERIGRSLLPNRRWPRGYGGWVYNDLWEGGGYVLTVHSDLARAVRRLVTDETVGYIAVFRDDDSFKEEVHLEPGHVVSSKPQKPVDHLIVRGDDTARLPEFAEYS